MAKPRTARKTADGGTVSIRFLDVLLTRAVREGQVRNVVIAGAGLDDVDFGRPDGRLPVAREAALWHFLASCNFDGALGLRSGAGAAPRDYGLAGYAMAFSATLKDAFLRLIRYHHLISEAMTLRVTETRDALVITETDIAAGIDVPVSIDHLVAALVAVSRAITGVHVIPIEVSFAYPQPKSTLAHLRFFECPLRFAAPRTSVSLRLRDCALPVLRGDDVLASYLSEHAETVLRQLTEGSSFTDRARGAIWAQLSGGRTSLATVAKALGIAPRTLQRRLAEEGTSVHEQVEHVRRSMATATLRERGRSIDEVAFLLGYNEPSSFYRSFKRWTGRTPQEYRRDAA